MRRLIAALAFAALTFVAPPALAQESPPEYGQGPGVQRAKTLPRTGGDQLPIVAPTAPTANPWPLLAVALTCGVAGFALDARTRGRREDRDG